MRVGAGGRGAAGNELTMDSATFDAQPPESPAGDHTPVNAANSRIVNGLELSIIFGVIVVDQLAKLAVKRLLPLHESYSIIPNLLDFTHVQNTGAAFGLLNAADFPYKSAVMIVIAI